MSGTEPKQRVAWLGHATTLIDLDGTRLLTDPVLRPRVAHLHRAWSPDAQLLRGVDAVLVSHVHFDHLDLPSLERLGRTLPLIVPRGAGGLLRLKRFERVLEVTEGDELQIGQVTVVATHAEHDSDRGPLGTKAPSLGFVVHGSRSVYFAGDTDLFPEMSGLTPELDVALLPVAGWGPKVGPGHLDPARAAEAVRLLEPRVSVPIHWGTYTPWQWTAAKRLSATQPPEEFARLVTEVAPGVRVEQLGRNGVLVLD